MTTPSERLEATPSGRFVRIRGEHPHLRKFGLRSVALFEGAKGMIALAIGTGAMLVTRDAEELALRLVSWLHLDPVGAYPAAFIRLSKAATPGRLQLIALFAVLYALLRFIEGAGLWNGRRWAEWLGVITGLIWVPIEINALVKRPGPEPVIALALNLLLVGFLAFQLRARKRRMA